ncbi:MAG: NAD(P)(+) transhydrogenase (Re/Si-specific) subunit beta, partial [Pseudomonadota bacterium]
MDFSFTLAAYAVAAVLFILSLGGLSGQESAKRAVWYGIVGMAIAVLATLIGPGGGLWWFSVVLIALGAMVGYQLATRVQMTQMPELVAIMHSLVGLAAVFVGFNADIMINQMGSLFAENGATLGAVASDGLTAVGLPKEILADLSSFAQLIAKKTGVEITILRVELVLGIWIGAVTFTGSVIAYGKLAGRVDSAAKKLPGGHMLNAGAAALSLILMLAYLGGAGSWTLVLLTLAALFIGYHLIMGIGGADMPVVVSMLNSYSGWAAAAIGFSLGNDLLIVVGALVGSSGAILSYIMCKAMNRSFVSVILGGFGETSGPQMEVEGEMVEIPVDGVAGALNDADSVIIIPGYGMAVAQAQQAVSELTRKLRAKGKAVRFAIHPVAGRLPGHMNVLLAEAKVPYDIVLEMDEINDDFPETDVAIVIGSNDIVNPAAQDDP